jgi:hypothetical protein
MSLIDVYEQNLFIKLFFIDFPDILILKYLRLDFSDKAIYQLK